MTSAADDPADEPAEDPAADAGRPDARAKVFAADPGLRRAGRRLDMIKAGCAGVPGPSLQGNVTCAAAADALGRLWGAAKLRSWSPCFGRADRSGRRLTTQNRATAPQLHAALRCQNGVVPIGKVGVHSATGQAAMDRPRPLTTHQELS